MPITFLGDTFLPYPCRAELGTGEYILNLEYPITHCEKGTPGKVNLRAEDDYLVQTFGKAPVAVCLANNHIMDYGEAGLADTIAALDRSGIAYFGAGHADADCNNPLLIEVDGLSVALLGYVCRSTSGVMAQNGRSGVAPLDADLVCADVERARAMDAERVIVCLHWGAEDVSLPKPGDMAIAHRITDAGADLIIGHHSHCIQPFEVHGGKHIFYGLGNCLMPDLDVPAYFDDEGCPSRRFVRKWRSWNNVSLAVSYDAVNGSVLVDVLRHRAGLVCVTRQNAGRYALGGTAADYERRFRRAFMMGKLKARVIKYLHEPTLPRARYMKSLWRDLREKRYR